MVTVTADNVPKHNSTLYTTRNICRVKRFEGEIKNEQLLSSGLILQDLFDVLGILQYTELESQVGKRALEGKRWRLTWTNTWCMYLGMHERES